MNIGLRPGARGANVERLHQILMSAGHEIERGEIAGGEFGSSTLAALHSFQSQRGLHTVDEIDASTLEILLELEERITITINEGATQPTPPKRNEHHGRVRGKLVNEDGAPIAHTKVSLFAKQIRSETHLGDATTNKTGHYTIAYHRSSPLNLVARGYDDSGRVLAESATMFAAAAEVEIDFTTAKDGVVRSPSRFTTIETDVAAQLQGTPLEDLKENKDTHEIQFLASSIGSQFDDVAYLFIAHKLGSRNQLHDATLFGIFSQGIPAPLDAALAGLPDAGIDEAFITQVMNGVLAHSRSSLSQALTTAVAANTLPASYTAMQEAELTRLNALQRQSVGSAPYVRGKTPLNDLLDAGAVADAVKTAFVQAYADNGRRSGPTWKVLRADQNLSKVDLAVLKTTLSAGELLGGNLPLVKDTLQRLSQGALSSVQSLALLDQSDWVSRIIAVDPNATSIPSVLQNDTPEQRIARFAKALAERFASRYPTTAFVGGLTKAKSSSFATQAELIQFLTANTALSLQRTNIDQYLAAKKVALSAPALAELKTAQRLFRISPHYPSVEVLKNAGYQSAQSVYFAGRAPFLAQMTQALGSASLANAAYTRAQATYATALTTFGRFHLSLNGIGFAVTAPATPDPGALANLPSLQALFGSLDYCQCSDCRSVYSPAAYLVDLLQFLKQRAATGSTYANARDVLFAQRPDLQYIALGCSNTNITLPYIDLVNEILEASIAPPAMPISVIDTTGTSAERRALPQQILQQAYTLTAAAVFGLSLPFDLAFAQTAAYLSALGTSLDFVISLCGRLTITASSNTSPIAIDALIAHGLTTGGQVSISGVLGNTAANGTFTIIVTSPTAFTLNGSSGNGDWLGGGAVTPISAIAAAQLEINPEMHRVINGTDLHQAWERWGLAQNPTSVIDPKTGQGYSPTPVDWVAALGKVPVLLNRTGLSLQQLYQLLEVTWVTASSVTLQTGFTAVNGVQVVSCDTDAMAFTGLTADVLDRANRFLRLWKITGLSMWELDWALNQAGDLLNDAFLVFLADAQAVQKQLGLPFQEALSFWGPMGIRDATNHLGDDDTLVPSTYSAVFCNPTLRVSWSRVFVSINNIITAASNAAPIAITTAAPHGLQTGMQVSISGVLGNTAANGTFTIIVTSPTAFTLNGSTGNGTWNSGGIAAGILSGTAIILPSVPPPTSAQSANVNAITAALGLSADDISVILAATGAGNSLSVDTLNVLLRYARLASSLSLNIPDLILWIQLTGGRPFDGTPADTLEFLRRFAVLQGTGIVLRDLDYLLRHQSTSQSSLTFTTNQATAVLQIIRDAIAKLVPTSRIAIIVASNTSPIAISTAAPHGLQAGMQVSVSGVLGNTAANGTFTITVTSPTAFTLNGSSGNGAWASGGIVTPNIAITAASNTSPIAISTAAPHGLQTGMQVSVSGVLGNTAANGTFTITVTSPTAFTLNGSSGNGVWTNRGTAANNVALTIQTIVVQALATVANVTANVVTPVLVNTGVFPLSSNTISLLLAQTSGVDPAQFTQLINAFTSVAKAAALFTAVRASEAEFAFVLQNAAWFNWLDPSALPLTPTTVSPYIAFEALLRALTLDRRQPARTPKLFDVLGQWLITLPADLQTAITDQGPFVSVLSGSNNQGALAFALNGSNADITAIAAALNTQAPSLDPTKQPGSLCDVAMLTSIANALDVVARYSISGATLIQLSATPPTVDTATAAMGAFQAQYAQSVWFAAVQPVEDTLRQTRRDALVAYILGQGPSVPILSPLLTTDDIFDYYLMDPEMNASALTTRLLQASLTIQQFVQQCFLNLIPQVKVDAAVDPGWNQWSWMQQFRLWQANRQVFLYPENYLLPQLRKDKSPFFSDLENDLRQSNCDGDAVETAFESYLRKLVEVSRLVVSAHYHEIKPDGSRVLHVFAHTRGTPPKWYYRTRAEGPLGTGIWSAWENLNLDIASDHLLPVIWDQRLHLIWPVFKQVPEKAGEQTVPSGGGGSQRAANKYWAVEFAISERSAGQWQAKRTITEKMFVNKTTNTLFGLIDRPPLAFTFRASQDPSFNLQIGAYYNLSELELVVAIFFGGGRTLLHATQTAAGTLSMPEAPLSVVQASGLLPDSSVVDLSQEPTYALVTTKNFTDSLATPMAYNLSGQDLIYGFYFQKNPGTVPLYVLCATTPTGQPSSIELLGRIVNPHIIIPHQEPVFDSSDPFFIADPARVYFVQPHYYTVSSSPQEFDMPAYIPQWSTDYVFTPFYHPFARTFLRELEIGGVDRLMQRNLQLNPGQVHGGQSFDFKIYNPQPPVAQPYPVEDTDFEVDGAYSLYNWELFYHAPMFVASLLMQNQQYETAMKWLEYIFNPTDPSSSPVPGHFWLTKPFYYMNATDWLNQQIQNILTTLATDTQQGISDPATAAAIQDWLLNPFDPHKIARLRIGAYGKATVMKFLDNLIAWGDSLFSQYTMETVHQAEQLYVFADLILGPKPEQIRLPHQDRAINADAMTYAAIADKLDQFSNTLVEIENVVVAPTLPLQQSQAVDQAPSLPQITIGTGETLLFCIPPNDQLLRYWETVAQRLYNIRHGLNIKGIAQPLALYAPAINPLLAAEGQAVGGVGGQTFMPVYRFTTYLQRAVELTNDVRTYGALILSAFEKKDAERLAVLRANQELDIQTRMLDVRTQQVTEAQDQITVLQNQKAVVQIRYEFYSKIAFMNDWETAAIALQGEALIANSVAVVLDMTSGGAHMTPSFTGGAAGFGGSPMMTMTYGGENIGSATASWASVARSLAGIMSESGGLAATMGGYQRRMDEWNLQANLAKTELTQIDSQIAAATDRLNIASSELSIQNRQIANAQAVSDFLTTKYTNEQLYDWMLTQLTTVYTQAYQLAFGLAQQAESAFQYELGSQETFIQFGYWDSQHKGLTAGESLLFDLRRMEAQYLNENTRELELTKHVSLALTQPLALVQLLKTGTCNVSFDEALFDRDHPGHYFRRLRSVALTIPCVTGPYTGVNASFTLNTAIVRTTSTLPGGTYRSVLAAQPPSDPATFNVTTPGVSIATSSGQNDAGLFDLNLRDERWLPFEGQGAISYFTLELKPEDNSFDFSTITDVILHVRYTARPGIDEQTVRDAIKPKPTDKRAILVSVRNTFGDAYYRFFNPTDTTATQQTLTLPITKAIFPFSNLGSPNVADITVLVVLLQPPAPGTQIAANFGLMGGTASALLLQLQANLGAVLSGDASLASPVTPESFTMTVPQTGVPPSLSVTLNGQVRLDPSKIQDIVLIINYTIT